MYLVPHSLPQVALGAEVNSEMLFRKGACLFRSSSQCFALILTLLVLETPAKALRISAIPNVISAGDTFVITVEFDNSSDPQAELAENGQLRIRSSKLNEIVKILSIPPESLQRISNFSFFEVEFFTISSPTSSRRDSTVLNVEPGIIFCIRTAHHHHLHMHERYARY